MRRRTFFAIGSVGMALAMGCASILGIKDGKPIGDGGADGASLDAGRDIEIAPDVNVEANIANCDGIVRELQDGGAFLTSAGSDNNDCSFSSPCRSIQAGIVAAIKRGTPLYLAPGDYPGGLSVSDGTLVVEGGWIVDGGSWQPVCDYNLAHVQGRVDVGNGAAAVHISGTAKVVLRLLSVEDDPKAQMPSGGNRYGIFFEGSNLALENVAVRPANGLKGNDGPNENGQDFPNCSEGDAGPGANGGAGKGGSYLGDYTTGGFSPKTGETGHPGESGGGGGKGATGSMFQCPLCMGSGVFLGDGGIMPDGGGSCADSFQMIQGGNGNPGCGGANGRGGQGGVGGGASIGLYLVGNGQVVLRFGTLIAAGLGGKGGTGGGGAMGFSGFAGSKGQDNFALPTVCVNGFCQQGDGGCLAAGGNGGSAGGKGGNGGQGGGGAGGPSVGVAKSSTIAYTILDGSVVTFAGGGEGGAPNGDTPGDQGKERVVQ